MDVRRIKNVLLSFLVSATLLLGAVALSTYYLETYGMVLFFAAPFCFGFVYTLLRDAFETPTMTQILGEVAVAAAIAALGLLIFAIEGLICVVMSLPLVVPMILLGTFSGRLVTARFAARATAAVILVLPALLLVEPRMEMMSVPYTVENRITINADRIAVWENLIGFEEIRAAPKFPLVGGIAYPISARIEGAGIGAIRNCNFTTGTFVEPITVWEKGRHLAFTVTNQPPPLRELSPWDIHPPHLDHYFRSNGGEFVIEESGGQVILTGRSAYEIRLYPRIYWKQIIDYIVSAIHLRVLEHIKERAEAPRVAVY